MTTAQQPSNPVASASALALTYARSKMGKTTDILYSFPRGFFIGTLAALKPSIQVVGFDLHPSQVMEVNRVSDATRLIPKLSDAFDAIVLDDFSLLAERTFALHEKSKNGYKLWGALRDEVLEFRDVARFCKKHVILNCHELPPSVKNGMMIRGGPKLPGKLPEEFPAQCDLVLRAVYESSRTGPWPVVYRCTPSEPDYVTGDRNGVTPDMAPMNLGEVFRASGFPIRRAPGLEWMEAVVERGAQAIINNGVQHEQAVLSKMMEFIVANHTKQAQHIVWALRDARDRAALRLARGRILASFFAPPPQQNVFAQAPVQLGAAQPASPPKT